MEKSMAGGGTLCTPWFILLWVNPWIVEVSVRGMGLSMEKAVVQR